MYVPCRLNDRYQSWLIVNTHATNAALKESPNPIKITLSLKKKNSVDAHAKIARRDNRLCVQIIIVADIFIRHSLRDSKPEGVNVVEGFYWCTLCTHCKNGENRPVLQMFALSLSSIYLILQVTILYRPSKVK